MKQLSDLLRDLTDPGWREREAEMHRRLMERVPLRCSPTLTECPRCKNNIFKCDGLSPCRASCKGVRNV